MALALHWNKTAAGVWADPFTVDLDHKHFEGLDGVFVLWHGGNVPAVLLVGRGKIRDCLLACRTDPEVAAYKEKVILCSWAKIDRITAEGVELYLVGVLRPKLLRTAASNAKPVEVNLPGRGENAPPDAGLPPGLMWQDLIRAEPSPDSLKVGEMKSQDALPAPAPAPAAAPTPAAKPKRVSKVQQQFDELIAKNKPEKAGGLFGGQAQRPKMDAEALVVATVSLIIQHAVTDHASDIHLEPQEAGMRVRFRIDGILEQVLWIPRELELRPVSHIRVSCSLDPEKGVGTGKPEDGRMAVNVAGQEADLRLSTFPTSHGDKAVLRIIPRKTTVPGLDQLGLLDSTVQHINRLIRLPQGMIVVTGPTGSGKSTTLYTMLQALNEPSRNIVTLEDPIEKKIAGINQGSLNVKSGFTFSEGLRSILRQDPNIIMVGEIRDVETAEIAMSASLTGHLLFTTLHTNSALGAITRLLDMGLEPFLIASALTAVGGQRLARKLCEGCRESYTPTEQERAQLEALNKQAGGEPVRFGETLFRPKGCVECRDSGYRDRVMLFEIVELSAAARQLILAKAGIDDIRVQAVKDGMLTLLADGLRKAAMGVTSVDEVVRVADSSD